MKRYLFAARLLAGGLSAGPALAQQSRVGDWTIEKRTQDTHCNASRGYKDREDENRDYVVVVTLFRQGHRDRHHLWRLGMGQARRNPAGRCRTDDADIMKKAKWELMDKTTVRGIFE